MMRNSARNNLHVEHPHSRPYVVDLTIIVLSMTMLDNDSEIQRDIGTRITHRTFGATVVTFDQFFQRIPKN
jgi:hypothetical protein